MKNTEITSLMYDNNWFANYKVDNLRNKLKERGDVIK